MSSLADRVAKPGDADLDFDCDGITITSVVRDGNHILIGARGGFGEWHNARGDFHAEPGHPTDRITEVTLSVGYADTRIADHVYATFVSSRDRAVPLRVTGAPGKMTAFIEDNRNWLPIARTIRERH